MKKQPKSKPEPKFIPEEEREAAAKYFTLSNLAMLHYVYKGQLSDAFRRANEDMLMEVGSNIYPEKQDWDSMIEAGDPYCFEEWAKVKQNYVIN